MVFEKYREKALELIEKGFVGEIFFSDSKYEVEIKDKTSFWVFLEIDDEGNFVDGFCSCDEEEECIHLAASYFKIVGFLKKEPIHMKFKGSFWKALFFVLFKRYKKNKFLKKEKEYFLEGFSLKIQNEKEKKKIKNIIEKKKDLSFKFSSFSFEEVEEFKRGKGSEEMDFEISFFSDLAKYFFFLQEEKKYKASFEFFEDFLPKKIIISFRNLLILAISLKEEDLIELFPMVLKTIKTELSFFDYEEGIENILYDKEKTCFYISLKKEFVKEIEYLLKNEKKIEFGKWFYFPKKGFAEKKEPFFWKNQVVEVFDIPSFLENEKSLLEKYLINERIDFHVKKPKYFLFFDEKNNLHILSYIFEKEDFLKKRSEIFDNWAYIEDKGFFLLKTPLEKEKIIKKENVSDFIDHNKLFFQNITGFEIHFGNFPEEMVYEVTKDNSLKFYSKVSLPEIFKDVLYFGRWVYVKNCGFFSKRETDFPIKPSSINEEDVNKFIHKNRKDLQQIKNFFSKENPIKKIGIKIFLKDKEKIEVVPKVLLNHSYQLKDIKFFEDFVFIEKKGFFEIPFYYKLPKGYEKKKTILSSYENDFINFDLDKLNHFILYIENNLKKPKKVFLKIKEIRKDKKNYIIELLYKSNIGEVSLLELFEKIESKKRYFFSNAGIFDLKNKRFKWFKVLKKENIVSLEKNKIRFSFLEFLRLFCLEEIQLELDDESKKELEELNSFSISEKPDISILKSNLWPYQKKGVYWLWFLYCKNLSGILCDEMGLGKTHQAMALIAALMKKKKRKFLVVTPTSVLYHWQTLLKENLEGAKVLLFHGILRELSSDFDVLITSYGIIRQENELLSSFLFEVAIFDEVQVAKNESSKTHKALKNIKANMILGLTGTPIENNLEELRAIFSLILPSYLPSFKAFKDFFAIPIEKEKDEKKRDILLKLISPFILRRKKKEVLLDLPEKIETISYCDLILEQKKMYFKKAFSFKNQILRELEDSKNPINYIHIFSLLSKLKQICDHPALINKDFENYKNYHSGKFELFKELLNEANESNQKVVVFSQYLGMLKIFQKYLKENSIKYAIITGSVRDRKRQVDKFQKEEDCKVFLASLLAAGVGIDLSKANIVIHFDRWWNPAKENQATDRVHRIGQKRGVQVFKLVTKNTIEERIHFIIESKKYLIEDMLKKDDKELLSREEIIEILKNVPNKEEF